MSVQNEILLCLDLLVCLMTVKQWPSRIRVVQFVPQFQFVILNACSYLNSSGEDVGISKYHFEFSAYTKHFFITS